MVLKNPSCLCPLAAGYSPIESKSTDHKQHLASRDRNSADCYCICSYNFFLPIFDKYFFIRFASVTLPTYTTCILVRVTSIHGLCERNPRKLPIYNTRIYFYEKLRICVCSESFLKLSDFQYSEFLTSFLKVP